MDFLREMLRLTCMATFCIILDTYAQKLLSEDHPTDLRARLSANAKGETIGEESLSAEVRQPSSHLSLPLIDAFNPLEAPQYHNAVAQGASNQLVDWLQRLRIDLLRPLSPVSALDTQPSNADAAVAAAAVTQTQPQTTNSTHLGGLTESSFPEKADHVEEHHETLDSKDFVFDRQNRLKIGRQRNEDGTDETDKHRSTLSSTASTGRLQQDNNGTAEYTESYYDGDFGVEKIPEAEESGEADVESEGNNSLLERKIVRTGFDDPFLKHGFQTKNVVNSTQHLFNEVKELVTTMNLSQTQTDVFVEIIKNIVEEELKRRLAAEKMQTAKLTEVTEKPKLAGIRLHAAENGPQKFLESIDEYPESQIGDRYEDQIRPFEKLTADTRLSFDERRIIDDYRNAQDEFPEPLEARAPRIDFGREVRKKGDYKNREQAEYDRLINGITEPTTTFDYLGTRFDRATNPEQSRTMIVNTEKPLTKRIVPAISPTLHHENMSNRSSSTPHLLKQAYPPHRTTIIHGKATSSPRTMFERQAEDFKSRLLGNNGFNDIMRALEHANIGFYERSDYRN